MRRWRSKPLAYALGAVVCLYTGCIDELPPDVDEWPVTITSVAEVPEFAERSTLVSLTGRVEAQGDLHVLLSDGTGQVWVEVTAAMPDVGVGPVGVRAVVQRRRDSVRVRALEWAHDASEADAAPSRGHTGTR